MNDLLRIENERNNIIKFFKNNKVEDLKSYLELYNLNINDINNEDFDILIFVIENYPSSLEIIQFIVNQYGNLNYSFYCDKGYRKYSGVQDSHDISYRGYKVPLFSAIAKKKFKIADILLENKADINYILDILTWEKVHIFNYLYHNGKPFFDKEILQYIFSHGFNINYLNDLNSIQYFNTIGVDCLNIIFKYCIFDNLFILNLLNHQYKHHRPLSNSQLEKIIKDEKNKIKIDNHWYKEALHQKRYDIIKLFLDNDGNTDNLSNVECYRILEEAIFLNNYGLVNSLLNYRIKENFNSFIMEVSNELEENLNFETILIQTIETNSVDIIQLMIEILLINNDVFQTINFENILLKASKKNNSKVLTLMINLLFVILLKKKDINYFVDLPLIKSSLFYENLLPDLSNDFFLSLGQNILQKYDNSYFNLIINILIKLKYLNWIKYLLEDNSLKSKINIDINDRNKECPMAVAFHIDNLEIFEYLINYGADYNIRINDWDSYDEDNIYDNEMKFLFILALEKKKYGMIKYLLKYTIEINEDNIDKNYPYTLIKGILDDKIEDVQRCLYEEDYTKKNTFFISNNYSFTPLGLAYLLDHLNLLKLLIKYYNVNELDNFGYSILHYAIFKEDIPLIYDLIENYNAEINYIDNMNGHGNSALDIALHIKNEEIIYYIIHNKNVSLNSPNEEGKIPIVTLFECKNYSMDEKKRLVESLISKGSDVNFVDNDNNTPLVYAIQTKSLDLVKVLVEHGSNVNYIINHRDGYKESLLLYAIKFGINDIIKFLIDHQASIDLSNDEELSYLIKISKRGNTKLFEYLVESNVNNFTNKILENDILWKRQDLLKIIADYHLDINLKDKEKYCISI